MKIIILAAGVGSRLGLKAIPKALAPLDNGKTILTAQLDNFLQFAPASSLILVVGYRKEAIQGFLKDFPALHYVVNPDFATENTAKSLLRGIEGVDEDILWVNGDVLFKKEILSAVLQTAKSCMVVNRGQIGEEEVKYRSDEKGRILEVSKTVKEGQGEALGINYFSKKDVPLLREALRNCSQKDYFEKGIEFCIQQGMDVSGVVVDKDDCVEVDFPEDLTRANRLLASWKLTLT